MQQTDTGYTIQNFAVEELAKTYGTPLFVYDASIIDRQIEKLKQAFRHFPHRINYAAKALTNLAVLKHMKSHNLGLDVVSVNELRMGLDSGFDADDILFTSNSVSLDEIDQSIALGVKVNIDSLSLLQRFGQKYGSSEPCSIRLKLDPLVNEHSGSREWHGHSKFGIHFTHLAEVKTLVDKYGIQITGLHVHNSSGFLDIPVYLAAAERMFEIAIGFKNLDFIDFGGGITIPFHPNDTVIDVEELGSKLAEKVSEFYKEYGSKPEIWFEPGRFLVSECGYLLTQVTVVRKDRELPYAGTDTGFNHLLRPKLYDAYHEIVNAGNSGGEKQVYHITGNMCETDFLGKNRSLSKIEEGHILAIKNAGAYGSCMASNYNSRVRPAEIMIRNGEAYLIKKRETYEDLIRNQVKVNW
ncbi:MAG: diaminopimelate decarboxylase [Gracilimonas sp.]|uniref:diaminopimelate decarboxylase n=1 Tax=Gracilimonas sp. TaxID=1974203 RepID=UPI0037502419|nr:diaminopimelate decarboxylase [Gracilimonas sp.]